ncbi:S26 family signal peptidase [Streptomyces odontomachi]|uniref:S26 family signal peptidase n=1 Tax=Streptomyces odontomachi TaxID=2944940 RepID=UPI00210D35EF
MPPGALPDDVSCGHVPPGRLVLLGDNPGVSFDSRHLGCLPCERVLGTVVRRLSC